MASTALGVAAHFLNTLPDLADDAAIGIKGLPHRIGARRSRSPPPFCCSRPPWSPSWVRRGRQREWPGSGCSSWGRWPSALTGRGRMPFRYAVAIAVLDVTLLVLMAQP